MNFLKHLGSLFKSIVHIGEQTAFIAEPFVALAVPQVAGIFNTTLKTIVGGEAVFTNAAKNTSGSGADKAAAALPSLLPLFQNWAVANGFDANDPKVKAATQAAIDSTVAFAKSFDNITHATAPTVPVAAAVK